MLSLVVPLIFRWRPRCFALRWLFTVSHPTCTHVIIVHSYIADSAREQFEANPVFWLATRSILQARNFPLWFRAGKKVCGADSQSSYLSENTGEEGVKSGKNKEKIKRPSWVYCVTNTVGLLSRLSEIWNKSFLTLMKAKSFFQYNKCFIDQACSVKMAGY